VRSAIFERATPSVSVTAFIGNRPAVQSSTARSLFCPSDVEGFLEDFDLERLAAKHPHEIAHPILKPAQLGGWRHIVVGAHGLARPPSLISRLQRNTRLGDKPCRRAT
jgi:hypothetical protein